MTRFELDSESRDKRRVKALERIADALEARRPVSATTVRTTADRDVIVVVCNDGTSWIADPPGEYVQGGTIPGAPAGKQPPE